MPFDQDPFILVLSGYRCEAVEATHDKQIADLRLRVSNSGIQINGSSVQLEGTMDLTSFALKGSASADHSFCWLPPLQALLKQTVGTDYQLDVFEEDGRLLKRVQGPCD